jgi:hypothetical protein
MIHFHRNTNSSPRTIQAQAIETTFWHTLLEVALPP